MFRIIPFVFTFLLFFYGCNRNTDMIDDPGIPPSVPTGLRIYEATDGEIIIEWRFNPESSVKGYNIYKREESSESVLTGYTDADYFINDSLEYDTTYFYKITAVDIWNRESDFTSEVSAKPVNRYNPLKPDDVQINARNWESDISVYINWIKGYESDISGYNVYRSESPGFTADNTNLVGFTNTLYFSDTINLNFYRNYFYKIKAIDKGGLLSSESNEVNDMILEIPEAIFPQDNSIAEFFTDFIIKTAGAPATYRIGLQTNKFFGEIWSTSIASSVIYDTLKIHFNPPALELNRTYYWRIAAYSGNSRNPNSISRLFSLTFRN